MGAAAFGSAAEARENENETGPIAARMCGVI
jgi:hypothetical protein